jgi:site-specific DNA-methyltransferase (adenine-specific)
MPKSEVFNMDCMEGMKGFPDKYFDLGILDPPFGIGEDWKKRTRSKRLSKTFVGKYKNDKIPSKRYFTEVDRVCKNVIIFGYNYFVKHLGPTNYLIIWDKLSSNNGVFKYSKCEIAYTTFKVPCDIIRVEWDGSRMGKETGATKIHPHQRPIELHKILLNRYAKSGNKILDTHLGSGSSRIAAHEMGFDFTGYEIDKDYFEAQEKRFQQYKAQLKLFTA